MTTEPGTKFGPYEIIAPLGAGGMGEVWRARDTRLNRDVALKILPPELARNPERRARFKREAQILGTLSHPNILTVYDVGDNYVVTELVEGTTLRNLRFPVRKVLDIGAQASLGLAAAHDAGVTHRDLKPDNIMLIPDGRVKVLDFGLAKIVAAPGEPDEEPTRTEYSIPGAVMGTAGYMSPEQVRGQPADKRSDIFSLGVVLHELIGGAQPFRRASPAETMAAIVSSDAPPLPEGTPPAVVRLVDKCLAKQPGERWQSARDLAGQLRWLADGGSGPEPEKVVPPPAMPEPWGAKPKPWGWIVAAMLGVALTAMCVVHFRETPPEPPLTEFLVLPPDKATSLAYPAISPDGRTLAFTATVEGKRQLWIRLLDSVGGRPLAGTEPAVQPFWSPDGRFVGFFADGKLKKVELSSGVVQTLCDTVPGSGTSGGAWGRDGVIVAAMSRRGPLMRVSAAGGLPAPVTEMSEGELSHRLPHFLPDGRHFVYFSMTSDRDKSAMMMASIDGPLQSTKHRRLDAGAMPAYANDYLLSVNAQGAVSAHRFDVAGTAPRGEASPLGINVATGTWNTFGHGDYSVSSNGVLAYVSGESPGNRLEWRDLAGKLISVVDDDAHGTGVDLSPDDRRAAVSRLSTTGDASDIWLYDLERKSSSRFTFNFAAHHAVWSKDSSRIFFSDAGRTALYEKQASGATEEKRLLDAKAGETTRLHSFDGQHLLYSVRSVKGIDLWALPVVGGSAAKPFHVQAVNGYGGEFSPDGRWIAYQGGESGQGGIYVRGSTQSGAKWQVSGQGGGNQPRWRRDGRELYYLAPDRKLMAVDVKPSGTALEFGPPRELFSTGVGDFPLGSLYDVTADGQRFLILTRGENEVTPIRVLLNWTRKLDKR